MASVAFYIQKLHDAALADEYTPAAVRAMTAAQVATICEVTPPEPGFFVQVIRSRAAAKLERTLKANQRESRRVEMQAAIQAVAPGAVLESVGKRATIEGPAWIIRRAD